MKKPWLITSGGRKFYPFDPQPEDVNIRDIAHQLSLQVRWNGCITQFYSVAQHSIMVSRIVEETHPQLALEGFCHDFAESYIGDMPSPIKAHLPDFKALERKVEVAIASKFKLLFPWPGPIKQADFIALMTEAVHLFDRSEDWVRENIFGLPIDQTLAIRNDLWIKPMTPIEAEVAFFQRYHELLEWRNRDGAFSPMKWRDSQEGST